MKRSGWGGYGSLWDFLCNKRPGAPSVFEVAELAWRANREITRQRKEIMKDLKAAGLEWDPEWDRTPRIK